MNSWMRRTAVVVLAVYAAGTTAGERRAFTVRDSIELSTFLSPHGQWKKAARVMFSPDGSHFIAATLRGNLASGKREATLWLFDSKDVREFASVQEPGGFSKAVPLVRVASASNREPVTQWRWSTDSQSVLYLAADDDGAYRLHRVSVTSRDSMALSRPDQDVSRFDERSGAVVYLAHAPVRAAELYQVGGPALPDMVVGTGKNVLPLLFPKWMDTVFDESEDELWTIDGTAARPVPGPDGRTPIRLKDSKLALSPDGRRVVVTTLVQHIPKSWERYRPLMDYPGMQIVADTPETEGSSGYLRPRQYALVDLVSGRMSLLIDAPIEFGAQSSNLSARWSADGARVALPGAYPALSSSAEGPVYSCAIMVVETQTRETSCALPDSPIEYRRSVHNERERIVAIRWRSARQLEVDYAAPNAPNSRTTKLLTRHARQWTSKSHVARPVRDELTVQVHEAIDDPPVLMARIGEGSPGRLLDPNPQLKQVALGTAELYRWKDADGDEWTGALVKPPGYSPARRYPLVIQTHNLDRGKFLVDGPSATGYAARALAARDMLVLQVDELNKHSGTVEESAAGAAGYRAAIEQLVTEGRVDANKVGIITWSHMGPYAMQGLIDQPHAYAAATFADAAYNSYTEYLMNIDYMGVEREQMFRAQFGAKPFGDGLQKWLERSAGFHTDRVCTPILFQVNSPPSLVYAWDAYAALRAQGKPIELFYIRNGDHALVKPLQRLAEQGMNVDWYDYWLNGRKDPDPEKSEQYRRWDAMKAARNCAADRSTS